MIVSKGWFASLLVVALFASAAFSAEEAAEDEEKAVLESSIAEDGKPNCCFGACTLNFCRELGVPFDYLGTLGAQIHEARKKPDPVALAACARSLAAAEVVAGKTASVTSDDVMKEAIQLAKLRRDSQELQAVSTLVSDENTRKALCEAAEAVKPSGDDAGSKSIHGSLCVDNASHECLRIYVDGMYHGEVHSGQSRTFHVQSCRNPNHLDAYCDAGHLVSHRHMWGHHRHVHWHICH